MSDIIISNIGPNVSSQFDELRVTQKTPIVELTSVYGLSILRDVVTTTGAGTVTNDATEYNLSNTASGIDSAILESVLRGRYEPGYAGEAGIGVRIPSLPTGSQVGQWGLFDTQNGAFFGVNSTNVFVSVRRAGVDTTVPQSLWNVDPLNGTGPSGATLNLSKGNIFQIMFTWYGYGVIEFRVVIPDPVTLAQEVITVHRFSPTGQTSFVDPNLPLRAQIANNGTGAAYSIFVGGRQYSIIGKYDPTYRVTSERRRITNVTSTITPVISFTRKAVFPAGSARTNSVQVNLEEINIISSVDLSYQVLVGGTLNGSFVNYPTATTIIPDSETALLVNNISTTITGGEVVFQGITGGGAGNTRILASSELLNFTLPENQVVTLAVSNIGGAGSNTVDVVFRVTESW
ncbi:MULTISPECIES: hypothetical protein [unclassified Paenibacillus]|uniref:hypothetical protein n=1 Tax=unclassified Paenibacillus TaxID=185978 RepID=UPI0008D7341F|nr:MULTISPECIES: hypothetical protein [unclassified Paenibacillus]QLG40681.1 hypothetical protein HW560_22960 [Paenibacillus sp. E222]SEN61155.1 hypothetical protein SAMN05518670_2263 [Paenibacillus sp. OK076]